MRVKDAASEEPATLTPEQFRESPEFRKFKGIMRKLLKVPKVELDHRVRRAKALSPRAGNPNAAGRKARMKNS
jgi:hypothetical protein